jgi:hypothetical protein
MATLEAMPPEIHVNILQLLLASNFQRSIADTRFHLSNYLLTSQVVHSHWIANRRIIMRMAARTRIEHLKWRTEGLGRIEGRILLRRRFCTAIHDSRRLAGGWMGAPTLNHIWRRCHVLGNYDLNIVQAHLAWIDDKIKELEKFLAL